MQIRSRAYRILHKLAPGSFTHLVLYDSLLAHCTSSHVPYLKHTKSLPSTVPPTGKPFPCIFTAQSCILLNSQLKCHLLSQPSSSSNLLFTLKAGVYFLSLELRLALVICLTNRMQGKRHWGTSAGGSLPLLPGPLRTHPHLEP